MAKSANALVMLMRVMAGFMMVAIFAAFMPDAWLKTAVEAVEPGASVGPLVEYVARGWSAFYFMLGGLIWLFSTDLPRYLPASHWLSWCYVLINGAFLFVIGWLCATSEGWDWFFWVIAFDVAVAFLFGLAMLLLSRKIPEASPA